MSARSAVYELRNVTYRYQEVTALDDLSLTIDSGSRIALLGANGSGKSTLLRVLDGLYFPQKGTVEFMGDVLDESGLGDDAFAYRFRQRVGLLFQNPDVQLFNPTVFDEVAFGPLHLGWPHEQIKTETSRMLDLFEIAHLRDRPPHHLSGGEKKKVALASVLVLNPDVLLLDEPTANLDPRSQTQMVELLSQWGDGLKTLVTATHDLHMLEDIATGCHVFERGRVIAAGSPAEVLEDRSLLARANLIHAHTKSRSAGHVHSHPQLHEDR